MEDGTQPIALAQGYQREDGNKGDNPFGLRISIVCNVRMYRFKEWDMRTKNNNPQEKVKKDDRLKVPVKSNMFDIFKEIYLTKCYGIPAQR